MMLSSSGSCILSNGFSVFTVLSCVSMSYMVVLIYMGSSTFSYLLYQVLAELVLSDLRDTVAHLCYVCNGFFHSWNQPGCCL